MNERFTACENVCRDFEWIAPFVSFLGSIVPIIAICWAVYVYNLQRKADREAELRREQREAYRRFFDSTLMANRRFLRFNVTEGSDSDSMVSEILEARDDYETAFKILALSASPAVLKAAQKCRDNLQAHLANWANSLEKYKNREAVPKVEIQEEFSQVSREMRRAVREDERELLNVMRKEEFSDPLKFKIQESPP